MSGTENYNYNIYEISLENLVLIEIVAKLWKLCDIMSAVLDESWKFYSKYEDKHLTDNFKRLVINVSEKVSLISTLPHTLAEKVKRLIVPVGLHMCEWIALNKIFIDLLNLEDFLNSICWTYRGFIHTSSSVNLWIKKTDRTILFERACEFFVEDEIKRLSGRLRDTVTLQNYLGYILEHLMLNYWLYVTKKQLNAFQQLFVHLMALFSIEEVDDDTLPYLQNINFLMIKLSLYKANSCAFKYFFSKLSPTERSENAYSYLRGAIHFANRMSNEEHFEIIYYLHPQLNANQRRQILHHFGQFYLYSCSFSWKYQNQLTRTITMLENHLTIRVYCYMLLNIATSKIEGRYVIDRLIEDIWYFTPESLRNELLQYVLDDNIPLLMFEGNVAELNEIILVETTATKRNELYSFFEI